MNRTHHNNELSIKDLNKEVTLIGWVSKKRNLGSLVFIDLRDRYGITQLICNEDLNEITNNIRNEYIIEVTGIVNARKDANPSLKTGEIEVLVSDVKIINSAKTTPLIIANETDALEDTRLKYRYLDLRRPVMQEKIILRHHITRSIRDYLNNLDFVDIETPMLTKSTPEGARDYLVPSRVHDESFYALPQSPQLFKQLLMVSGFEKYYQIVKCFRDEDLRADRQPEFTQVDIETSFYSQEDIFELVENLLKKLMKDVKDYDLTIPFARMSYDDAMNNYGSDKPDLRFDLKLQDINDLVKNIDFNVFKDCLSNDGSIKALVVKNAGDKFSRKDIDKLQDLAKKHHAKGLAWIKYQENEITGPIAKFFDETNSQEFINGLNLENNDLVLIVADSWHVTCDSLGNLRNYLGKELNLIDENKYEFLWIIDWPLFEYDEKDNRYYAAHHPFTRPDVASEKTFFTNPKEAKAQAYDIVLNGYELGGGSLRIYDQEMQQQMFEVLGFTKEEIDERFGFFIDAFQYGTPPHGGIALGLDRIAMLLSNSESIRDVIAFPKNASATCVMSNAPSLVDEKQKDELGLKTFKK